MNGKGAWKRGFRLGRGGKMIGTCVGNSGDERDDFGWFHLAQCVALHLAKVHAIEVSARPKQHLFGGNNALFFDGRDVGR